MEVHDPPKRSIVEDLPAAEHSFPRIADYDRRPGVFVPMGIAKPAGQAWDLAAWLEAAETNFRIIRRARDADVRAKSPDQTLRGLPAFDAYKETYLWDFFPPTFSCPARQRIGRLGEGGKWVCGAWSLQERPLSPRRAQLVSSWASSDPQLRDELLTVGAQSCVVYSFGVRGDISFEVEVLAGTSCAIRAYDPSVASLPAGQIQTLPGALRDRLRFEKTGLASTPRYVDKLGQLQDLATLMRQNGDNHVDLAKIDIEGWEWNVLASLAAQGRQGPLGKIDQMLVEVHFETNAATQSEAGEPMSVARAFATFQALEDAGFRIASFETNWSPPARKLHPCCVEIVFVRPGSLASVPAFPEP